jgi:hypothetical protein
LQPTFAKMWQCLRVAVAHYLRAIRAEATATVESSQSCKGVRKAAEKHLGLPYLAYKLHLLESVVFLDPIARSLLSLCSFFLLNADVFDAMRTGVGGFLSLFLIHKTAVSVCCAGYMYPKHVPRNFKTGQPKISPFQDIHAGVAMFVADLLHLCRQCICHINGQGMTSEPFTSGKLIGQITQM